MKSLSRVQLFATPWTVSHQAPLPMGFSRQEYWSGLPFPSPGDLPNPGIEPRSPALQADALTSVMEATKKEKKKLGADENNKTVILLIKGLLQCLSGKESACNAGQPGSGFPRWR